VQLHKAGGANAVENGKRYRDAALCFVNQTPRGNIAMNSKS
jgi:hypothetical protein